MIQSLYTLFFTVAFCLGWRIITDEGQILYFIRKFFEDCQSDNDHLATKEITRTIATQIFINKVLIFVGTPFVLCITCLASIWGTIIFITLCGIHPTYASIAALILNCVSASFIQTFIWKKYAQLD